MRIVIYSCTHAQAEDKAKAEAEAKADAAVKAWYDLSLGDRELADKAAKARAKVVAEAQYKAQINAGTPAEMAEPIMLLVHKAWLADLDSAGWPHPRRASLEVKTQRMQKQWDEGLVVKKQAAAVKESQRALVSVRGGANVGWLRAGTFLLGCESANT